MVKFRGFKRLYSFPARSLLERLWIVVLYIRVPKGPDKRRKCLHSGLPLRVQELIHVVNFPRLRREPFLVMFFFEHIRYPLLSADNNVSAGTFS